MVKNPPVNAGDINDTGSIPESGRFPGGENGNPHQCSCLENSMDRGALQATVHKARNNWMWLEYTYKSVMILGMRLKFDQEKIHIFLIKSRFIILSHFSHFRLKLRKEQKQKRTVRIRIFLLKYNKLFKKLDC